MEAGQRGDAPFRPSSLSNWDQVLSAIELVGPKGYIHGWIKVAEQAGKGFMNRHYYGGPLPSGDRDDISYEGGWPQVRQGIERQVAAAQPRPLQKMMADFDKTDEAKDRASGLWGPNRTYAQHAADVDKLNPDQKAEYVRQTINGASAPAALKAAQNKVPYRLPSAEPITPYPQSGTGMGFAWGTVLTAIELSAQTARLAVMPAPRGRPGGPGLYDVKGLGHTPYLQNIVKALIHKRGMPPGRAYAIARGAIRRWSRGGGKVHPEVRVAATTAEAGELAKQAEARLKHGH